MRWKVFIQNTSLKIKTMEKPQELPLIKEIVSIKLRLADSDDLKIDSKNLKIGQPYWVKSMFTGEFDNKNLIISSDTDVNELAIMLKNNMVWIPDSFI